MASGETPDGPTFRSSTALSGLGEAAAGADRAARLLRVLRFEPELQGCPGDTTVNRATVATALNVLLMDDLLSRTPTAAAYIADRDAEGAGLVFDHGALRTIRFASGPTGAAPAGEAAFTRILEPLGYRLAGVYPLPRLGMTGRAYAHLDRPEAVPQVFLSELHVELFSPAFQAAAHAVFDSTTDPLNAADLASLTDLQQTGGLKVAVAERLLLRLTRAFGRHHAVPRLVDYQTLLAQSPEAAWIATEGSAFNHATDRVADVDALAEAQRALGRPMKPAVEVSASGRVRQTAFRADPVQRAFRDAEDREVRLSVPGSFYEFITRDLEPGAGLDLRFDSANAQGIFKMTRPQGVSTAELDKL